MKIRFSLWRLRAVGSQRRHIRCNRARKRLALLTRRERQVLQLTAKGFTDKEIGSELNISSRTSQIHRGNMFRKLRVTRSAAAARMLIEAELEV